MRDALVPIADLWGAIYGDGPGFLALFSGRRPTPGAKLEGAREAYFAWPRETVSALAWVGREADQDRELYHCGHLVGRWRRRKTDALPLRSLYVDLDAGLPEAPAVAPNILVASSPGHYQAYVRLTHTVPPAEGAELTRRLAHALGADPSGWDLTQLLRVPATVNHKYAGRPVVRLVERTGREYAPEQLDELLPRLPVRGQSRAASVAGVPLPPVGSDPPIPLTRSALNVWQGEDVKVTPEGRVDRSASLIRIARMLHQAGLAPEHIAAVLAERDAALGWKKYAERTDAAEQYRRMVDVVARGSPTRRQR